MDNNQIFLVAMLILAVCLPSLMVRFVKRMQQPPVQEDNNQRNDPMPQR